MYLKKDLKKQLPKSLYDIKHGSLKKQSNMVAYRLKFTEICSTVKFVTGFYLCLSDEFKEIRIIISSYQIISKF